MPMFPASRPANVTNDPETVYNLAAKTPFPGSRAPSVTRDPQRDGDTGARKGHFPSSYPYSGVTKDPLRDRDAGQGNNAVYGGENNPGGAYSYPSQDPEHAQTSDAARDAKPSAVTAVTATAGAGQVSVAFTPGAVKGDTYLLKLSPGGKSVTDDASPLVITGLTAGAYTGTIQGQSDNGLGASAAVSSFTVT